MMMIFYSIWIFCLGCMFGEWISKQEIRAIRGSIMRDIHQWAEDDESNDINALRLQLKQHPDFNSQ